MEKVAVPLAAQLCAIKFNAQSPAAGAAKTEKLQVASYTHSRSEQLDDACAHLILAPKNRNLPISTNRPAFSMPHSIRHIDYFPLGEAALSIKLADERSPAKCPSNPG
jgi:hypothetical protein